jgi:hypothetical protein
MKMTNFASLDPEVTSSGRKGLANASAADRAIWDEMQSDWERFAFGAEAMMESLGMASPFEADPIEAIGGPKDYTGKDRPVERLERVGQQFFRRTVLSAYDYRCCITGLAVQTLLIASHIVPWRTDSANRLNPRNGLCLSALHDRAFDAGLITIAEDMSLCVSRALVSYEDRFFESSIRAYDGKPVSLPQKFLPDTEFLRQHRETVFLRS